MLLPEDLLSHAECFMQARDGEILEDPVHIDEERTLLPDPMITNMFRSAQTALHERVARPTAGQLEWARFAGRRRHRD